MDDDEPPTVVDCRPHVVDDPTGVASAEVVHIEPAVGFVEQVVGIGKPFVIGDALLRKRTQAISVRRRRSRSLVWGSEQVGDFQYQGRDDYHHNYSRDTIYQLEFL